MKLSQETLDLIIDHLSGDKPALATVARVSHSFIPCSRKHLFQTLRLLPRQSTKPSHTRTLEFIALCNHPLSTILDAGPTTVELTPEVEPIVWSYRDERNVPIFTTLLSWLNDKPTGEHTTYAETLFRKVQHLTISYLELDESLQELQKLLLLSPFPRIIQVAFIGDPFLIMGDPFIQMAFPPSLTHVEVAAPHVYLPIFKACSTLQYLSITVEFPDYIPQATAINQFLELSAAVKNGSLMHCHLVVTTTETGEPVMIGRLLEPIRFETIPSWTIETEAISFLYLLDDQVVIPNVTTIMTQRWERISLDEWMTTGLDNVLMQFTGLEEVKITLTELFDTKIMQRSGWDKVTGTVREDSEAQLVMDEKADKVRLLLPQCESKGLLKVVYTYVTMAPYICS